MVVCSLYYTKFLDGAHFEWEIRKIQCTYTFLWFLLQFLFLMWERFNKWKWKRFWQIGKVCFPKVLIPHWKWALAAIQYLLTTKHKCIQLDIKKNTECLSSVVFFSPHFNTWAYVETSNLFHIISIVLHNYICAVQWIEGRGHIRKTLVYLLNMFLLFNYHFVRNKTDWFKFDSLAK